MSDNQQYDIKCLYHPNEDIISICSTCPNNTPVCIDCITNIHNGHDIKILKDISLDDLRDQIQQEYNNQTTPKLNDFLENNKKILDELNNYLKQIQNNHTMNLDKTTDIFKGLTYIIKAKENDVKRLLTTKFDENTEVNALITSTIENNNNIVNNAIKFNNNNNDNVNNNNNKNGFIELLKHNHQCKNILSNIDNNNLPEYKYTQLIIKEKNLDSIKDLTNSYLEVIDDNKKDLKTIEVYQREFTNYEEGCDIGHIELLEKLSI
ncbi:hypothetical protein DICPUDRAFT_146484 [Dictyostelium purpureum]|uniref:B box-type domain-containing protein n=1 Tax=Dictyostelium purpureum TaxID=5786 RepID=F0Z633_DICPU|nr:uncharacterized protein DICPUDRAFT_146484 [Dictyostelium purpureum]EGC40583.1 hypothetical protein DICPUDRAFT_146484 [Dictyostelium purpureum]|eukprot:XP_003282919.1 hypothetical protein DICPUDRAFT_146484 [Dictyostelium purpureum]